MSRPDLEAMARGIESKRRRSMLLGVAEISLWVLGLVAALLFAGWMNRT